MTDLTGLTALVTGAGSGIGRAIARELVDAGARVVVADLDMDAARATADLMGVGCDSVRAVTVDISDHDSVRAMVDEAASYWGNLDIAINNAGIGAVRSLIHSTAQDALKKVVEVNILGTWYCVAEELRVMKVRANGVIVNIASATALHSAPGMEAYAMTKAAVVHLSRTAAIEYAADNIRVHAICPGPIATPMLEKLSDGMRQRLVAGIPIGRIGTPEDVARAVAWLSSPQSSYLTGSVIPVDGGESAR